MDVLQDKSFSKGLYLDVFCHWSISGCRAAYQQGTSAVFMLDWETFVA